MTKKSTEVFSYPIPYNELIQTWINVNEKLGHVLVLYEPKKHQKYLDEINLPYTEEDMYLAEVLALEFLSIDDAKFIMGFIDHTKGPFVQLWSLGQLITDNIEFNPLTD